MVVQNSYERNSCGKKIVPEDEQCFETDLTLIVTVLRFLVFEIW